MTTKKTIYLSVVSDLRHQVDLLQQQVEFENSIGLPLDYGAKRGHYARMQAEKKAYDKVVALLDDLEAEALADE